MNGNRRWTRTALLMTLALVVAGCPAGGGRHPVPVAGGERLKGQAFTPHPDVVNLLVRNYTDQPAALVTEVAMIDGYHDAQGLPNDYPSADVGPEVRLYTGPRARTFDELQNANGAFVAAVQVVGNAAGLPTYAALGLGTANNSIFCLFLRNSLGSWSAAMVPADGSRPNGCRDVAGQFQLSAIDRTNHPASEPAVVRIVDALHDTPYFGVVCGGRWCEIGADASALVETAFPAADGDDRKWRGDEQTITEPERQSSGRTALKRRVRAAIRVVQNFDNITAADYQAIDAQGRVRGVRVAVIHLAREPKAQQYTNWSLSKGNNHVWMRRVGGDYMAQFVPQNGTVNPDGTWFRINRMPHSPGIALPKVARWIWYADDEGVWITCDQGCCEVRQQRQ